MTSRRDKRAHLDIPQQIEFIHDDLDEVQNSMGSMRKEMRLLLIGIIIAVIGTGMWSNL